MKVALWWSVSQVVLIPNCYQIENKWIMTQEARIAPLWVPDHHLHFCLLGSNYLHNCSVQVPFTCNRCKLLLGTWAPGGFTQHCLLLCIYIVLLCAFADYSPFSNRKQWLDQNQVLSKNGRWLCGLLFCFVCKVKDTVIFSGGKC